MLSVPTFFAVERLRDIGFRKNCLAYLYFPNSFNGPIHNEKYIENPITIENNIQAKRYDSSNEDNYSQGGIFWRRVLKEDERERLIQNMSSHLVNAADFLQERAVNNFTKCDEEFGKRLRESLLNFK